MISKRNNTKFVEVLIAGWLDKLGLPHCHNWWQSINCCNTCCRITTHLPLLLLFPCSIYRLYIQYTPSTHATHLRHRFVIKIVIAHNGFITIALSRRVSVSFLALALPSYLFRFYFGLHWGVLGGGQGSRVTTATPTLGHGPHRVSQSGRKTNLVFRLPQRNKFNNIFVFLRFVFYFFLSFNVFFSRFIVH